ncbi:hypothetical protein [Gemmata massiliana]|uniref:hypothetical protein n=1 Tax=Gemmata massiliana TaxID=1210884 RepID=UPI001E428DAB|nr:hypothetical protein [Gemmata massiliana]
MGSQWNFTNADLRAVSKAAKGASTIRRCTTVARMQLPVGGPKSGDSGYQGSDLWVPKRPRRAD